MAQSDCLLLLRRVSTHRVVVTNIAERAIPVGTRITEVFKHGVTVEYPSVHRVEMGQVASVQVVIDEISLREGAAAAPEIPIGWSAAVQLRGHGINTLTELLQNAAETERFLLR